jgi:excisionase family DNA binding protein
MSDHDSQPPITEVAGMEDPREDDLLTEAEAAERMRVALVTLRRWRKAGTAPPSRRLGRQYRYRRGDIDSWVESRPPAGERAASSATTDAAEE